LRTEREKQKRQQRREQKKGEEVNAGGKIPWVNQNKKGEEIEKKEKNKNARGDCLGRVRTEKKREIMFAKQFKLSGLEILAKYFCPLISAKIFFQPLRLL
jgi:hypothetical protein